MIASTASGPSSFRPAGSLPAAPLAPYAGPWDARRAAHLLRRAGFGGSTRDVARLASLAMPAAVDALVRFPATDALPARPETIDTVSGRPGGLAMLRRGDGDDAALMERRKAFRMLRRRQEVANAVWWLDRMLVTTAPLQEKMTLFLHGHFTSASGQKGIYGTDIVDQNWLYRTYALGDYRELTHKVARDRAMLKYLDNARSDKAHPNENFARELMELFTLGIGNYSEADVREGARAFTGYTFARRTGEFTFVAERHDDGTKTFLGKTGNFNGDDVIDIIFEQPAASAFLARKLLAFFVYDDPEPQLVDALAAVVRERRFNLEPVVATILQSNVFYSDRAYRALVKSPIDYVVGAYQLFGITSVDATVLGALARMGQIPFHPPSVKGWDGGVQWLNTQTLLARENFASTLVALPAAAQGSGAILGGPPASANAEAQRLVGTILQGDASPAALARLEAYLDGRETSTGTGLSGENADERLRGAAYLTMAMPAYQLS